MWLYLAISPGYSCLILNGWFRLALQGESQFKGQTCKSDFNQFCNVEIIIIECYSYPYPCQISILLRSHSSLPYHYHSRQQSNGHEFALAGSAHEAGTASYPYLHAWQLAVQKSTDELYSSVQPVVRHHIWDLRKYPRNGAWRLSGTIFGTVRHQFWDRQAPVLGSSGTSFGISRLFFGV